LYGEDKEEVYLTDFSISKYPITYAQYQVFMDDEKGFTDQRWWDGLAVNQSSESEDQKTKVDNHPRENVSWYDAIAFCRWLSWRVGGGYDIDKIAEWAVRLPTEFEWEKAGRGQDGIIYPYGNEFDSLKSNTSDSRIKKPTPVNKYLNGASPYGVMDMSGNVWEWCLSDYEKPTDDCELVDMSSDCSRVLRGGSWFLDHSYARTVSRLNLSATLRYLINGFRICSSP
jgi:formylglycine-generating enzyme required for sulfatase activity